LLCDLLKRLNKFCDKMVVTALYAFRLSTTMTTMAAASAALLALAVVVTREHVRTT
jgi:hypothetical protein